MPNKHKKKVSGSKTSIHKVDHGKENTSTGDLDLDGMQRIETADGPRFMLKAPHGKVKETGPPKDYQAKDLMMKEVNPAEINDDDIHYASVPPKYYNRPDDPEGHTEWIVKANTKKKAFDYPGFPQHLPKLLSKTPNYVLRESPGMGLGLYATRDLEIGELVFAERPLLIVPRAMGTYTAVQVKPHYTLAQLMQAQLFEAERTLECVLGRMSQDNALAFKALANCHKEDGSGPLVGILRTNLYGIDTVGDGPWGTEITNASGYTACGNIASRINHSCVANVTHVFDVPSFSLQFFASRKIKEGEQIFYSYVGNPAEQPVATRQKFLEPYGFMCECSLCANVTLDSDERLSTLFIRRHNLCSEVAVWLLKPFPKWSPTSPGGIVEAQNMDIFIKKLEEMDDEGEKSGDMRFQPLMAFLHELYVRAGKSQKAKSLAKDIVRHALLDSLTMRDPW